MEVLVVIGLIILLVQWIGGGGDWGKLDDAPSHRWDGDERK